MNHAHPSTGCCACGGGSTEKKTILVVDDDSDYLFQQKRYLEGAGYEVLTAENESEAKKVLAQRTPDVAVLDLMMEHADGGFVLCHHIRQHCPSVPIVLVSSVNSATGLNFGLSEDERQWIKADAFLAKPIRFEQLTQQIDRLLAAK